jgi:hypothetical protein
VLDKLDRLHAGEPEFEKLLAEFTGAAREHIDFEETQVWPGLRAALTAEQSQEIGSKMEAGKKTAPTRPATRSPTAAPTDPPAPGSRHRRITTFIHAAAVPRKDPGGRRLHAAETNYPGNSAGHCRRGRVDAVTRNPRPGAAGSAARLAARIAIPYGRH